MQLHLLLALTASMYATTTVRAASQAQAQHTFAHAKQQPHNSKPSSSTAATTPSTSSRAKSGGKYGESGRRNGKSTHGFSFSDLDDPKLADCAKMAKHNTTPSLSPESQTAETTSQQQTQNGTSTVTLGKSEAAAMPLASSASKKTLGETEVAGYALVATPEPSSVATGSPHTDGVYDPKQSTE